MIQEFGKIRDLDSFYVEFGDDFTVPYQKGIYIDIFEMVDYPVLPSKILRFLLKRVSRSRAILKKKKYINFHALAETVYFGCVFCFLYPMWLILSLYKKGDRLSYVPFANALGWMYKKDDIYPLTTIDFEGFEFPSPNNPDRILSTLYGNYMTLPPVEKRQVHALFIKSSLSNKK